MDPIIQLNIDEFAQLIKLEKYVPRNRCSSLLLRQLKCGLFKKPQLDPSRILVAISDQEGISSSGTKKASKFNHAPLKGLWHKHYQVPGHSAAFKNIYNSLPKTAPPKTPGQGDGKEPLKESALIAEFFIQKGLFRRKQNKELTGQWLIYAVNNNENYYLCIGDHGDDEGIYELIIKNCLEEYPFLESVLNL